MIECESSLKASAVEVWRVDGMWLKHNRKS